MAYVLHRTPCCRSKWESRHNKKDLQVGIPNNVIKYTASEKLTETTTQPWPTSGLKTDAFSDSNGQRLTMKSHTFENGVGTIEFDGDIVSIGNNAFYGCSSLTSIEIPNSITSIGQYAFDNTPWWNAYSADTSHHYGNIIYINDVAYKATATTISSCTFREGTVGIGGSAFQNCTGLTSIVIPDSVTSIGMQAFDSCSGLTSLTISDSVTSISTNAFQSCTSLTSITIGNSVTSIGGNAFGGCSSLTSIVSNAMTAPTIINSTFYNVKTGGTLIVPSGSTGYDTWMGTNNFYLGKYNWTKVEQ